MKGNATGLVIKPSNIRIWIHQRDLGRLQKVLWEGHGAKLRTETSNNARVRKFLEAVPYLMVRHQQQLFIVFMFQLCLLVHLGGY